MNTFRFIRFKIQAGKIGIRFVKIKIVRVDEKIPWPPPIIYNDPTLIPIFDERSKSSSVSRLTYAIRSY